MCNCFPPEQIVRVFKVRYLWWYPVDVHTAELGELRIASAAHGMS